MPKSTLSPNSEYDVRKAPSMKEGLSLYAASKFIHLSLCSAMAVVSLGEHQVSQDMPINAANSMCLRMSINYMKISLALIMVG